MADGPNPDLLQAFEHTLETLKRMSGVLSTALNADRRIYDQLAAMLNTAGYNVLAFDFRGFGGSRAGEYTDFSAQRQKIIDGEYRLSSR